MLGRDYFKWLCKRVDARNYTRLLDKLAHTNYIWQFVLDKNRADGGLILRTEYSIETGVYLSDVADGPCSCLEMMIAYARRFVEQSGFGTEASFFNDFLFNTGLAAFDDKFWDESAAQQVIDVWLNRLYPANGQGNLIVTNSAVDLRRLDTWQQLAVYIEEFY